MHHRVKLMKHVAGSAMKLVILLVVLAIGIPPLQAGYADITAGQNPAHHMQHQDDESHPCCNGTTIDLQQNCCGVMLCGSCGTNVSVFPGLPKCTVIRDHGLAPTGTSGMMSSSHSPPLFRPPIS